MTDGQTILGGRYLVLRSLGAGGQGRTLIARARDGGAGEEVVVKELSSPEAGPSSIEHFRREARLLQRLAHPRIPRYLDFDVQAGDPPRFFLIQELVEGPTLQQLIDESRRLDEAAAINLTRQLLDILVYLQDLDPPVIHRDIKPANLILGPAEQLYLVDFGAAFSVLRSESFGGTFVGTTGYMAPEQFTGRATLASDLYSTGATLAHLLSHHPPVELLDDALRLRFESVIDVSSPFRLFLERLTEPAVEDRFPSAREARSLLDHLDSMPSYQVPLDHQLVTLAAPRDSGIGLQRSVCRLDVSLPPRSTRVDMLRFLSIPLLNLVAIVILIVLMPVEGLKFGGLLALASIWFYYRGFVRELSRTRAEHLRLSADEIVLTQGGSTRRLDRRSPSWEVEQAASRSVVRAQLRIPRALELVGQGQRIRFAEGISRVEATWLTHELNDFLETVGPSASAPAPTDGGSGRPV